MREVIFLEYNSLEIQQGTIKWEYFPGKYSHLILPCWISTIIFQKNNFSQNHTWWRIEKKLLTDLKKKSQFAYSILNTRTIESRSGQNLPQYLDEVDVSDVILRGISCTQRNLFEIVLNQTEIRLYLQCTDYKTDVHLIPNQSVYGK